MFLNIAKFQLFADRMADSQAMTGPDICKKKDSERLRRTYQLLGNTD